MPSRKCLTIGLCVMATSALLTACATNPPPELVSARQAYERISRGPTSQTAPAELHKAKESLDVAEQAFSSDPGAERIRDLAYVAQRKTELAEAIGAKSAANDAKGKAEREYQERQGQMAQQTRGELAKTREQLGTERQARQEAERKAAEAEQKAKELQANLAKLAAVKEEQRGLVITLSGSVLFASNQAILLPEAQARLSQVTEALLATKERNIIIEGHSDSRGAAGYNLDLSQRRAEAVRSFLLSHGYEADKVQARGIGKDRPIADNATAEGRANNRRVEIIVEPEKK